MLIQIVCEINYHIAEKLFNQHLQENKKKMIDFMNGLYLQCKSQFEGTGGS